MNCDAKHKTRTRASCALAKGHSSYHRWRPRGVECEHVEVAPGNLPECRACGCIVWPEAGTAPSSGPARNTYCEKCGVNREVTGYCKCGTHQQDIDARVELASLRRVRTAAQLAVDAYADLPKDSRPGWWFVVSEALDLPFTRATPGEKP